jgi:mono/diheme cytochrome c family protein
MKIACRLLSVATFMLIALNGAQANARSLTHAESTYLESCGGCHGIQGVSADGLVPPLKDRAGYFLCTEKGRGYIVQLPNVAFAKWSDAELADMMNFVVFRLGGNSAPESAKRYTPEEIRDLRAQPLRTPGLRAYRKLVVSEIVQTCKAPEALAGPAPGY